MAARRSIPLIVIALGLAGLAPAARAAGTACTPRVSILESPRAGTQEVQAKALNDRGDVVGFADGRGGADPMRAILWKRGQASRAVDLGVLPGYVASEAYGINNQPRRVRPAL